MNIREKLTELLEIKKEEHERYYQGVGALLSLRRLIRYPDKFIVRALSRSRVLSTGTTLQVKTFWGRDLWVLARDKNAASLYYFGVLPLHEQKLISFFIKHIDSNDIFYDLGANYGFYTVLAEALITDGEVHSFEPLPLVFRCLMKTAEGNHHNLKVRNLALSNISGPTTFYDGFSKGAHSGASTMIESVALIHPEKYRKIQVEAMRLDDYTRNNAPPTFMKIDVEGGELSVFKGGENTIRNMRPHIVMEVWGRELWGSISSHAVELLLGWGYEPYLIDENGKAHQTSKFQVKEEADRTKYDNFVFIHKEKKDELT